MDMINRHREMANQLLEWAHAKKDEISLLRVRKALQQVQDAEEINECVIPEAEELKEQPVTDEFARWGKDPGTIRSAEYAYLAWCCNQASQLRRNSAEKMRNAFVRLLQGLPEGHPLRCAAAERITAVRGKSGMEAITIELDPINALVLFAGTDSLMDGIIDANIALTRGFMNPQSIAANELIERLAKRGFTSILVSGHSLGGYLAADVTLRNECVAECRTFDPPAHALSSLKLPGAEERLKRIRNYIVETSIINRAGQIHPGETERIRVERNWIGPIPDHAMSNIFEDAFGGMSAIIEGLSELRSGHTETEEEQ